MAKPTQIHRVGEAQPFINMLLVAETGWGKTPFMGTADNRMLIASIDPEGTDSAAYAGSTADEWVIRTMEEWTALCVYMRKSGCSDYDWLGIDSLTELQKLLMKHQLMNRPVRGKQEPLVADQPDYLKTQLQLVELVKEINDLPVNVLWTALPMEQESADGEVRYFPAVHGGRGDLSRQVRGYMKINAAGEILGDEGESRTRRMHFIQTGPYMGRDRTSSLGDYQDDLTIPALEKLVAARRKRLTTPTPTSTAAKTVAAPTKKPGVRRRTVPSKTS